MSFILLKNNFNNYESLKIDSISDVTDDGKITFHSSEENKYYRSDNQNRMLGEYVRLNRIFISDMFRKIYKLNPNLDYNFYCDLQSSIDVNYDAEDQGPYIMDGRDDSCCWIWMLPPEPVLTAEILAILIKKWFIAICKIVKDTPAGESVTLFNGNYQINDTYDYGHHIVHEIDPVEVMKTCRHPRTIGEFRSGKFPQITGDFDGLDDSCRIILDSDSEDLPSEYKINVEDCQEAKKLKYRGDCFVFGEHPYYPVNFLRFKYNDEQLDKFINDPNTPKSLEKFQIKSGLREINGVFCGMQYFYNVPIEMQIKACAIVAGISYEETEIRLRS